MGFKIGWINWEHRELGEVSEKITQKNKDNLYSVTLTNSAEYGIIDQRSFFDKDISNAKNLSNYYVVHPDDFVYNPRISNEAPVGPIKRNNLDITGVMSPLYYVFRPHDINKTFLEYYFSTSKWHKFMKLNGNSGARSDRFSIKDSEFVKMPIPSPKNEEQVKIGKLLSTVATYLALQQHKLDQLNTLKKELLQKMFADKKHPQPELRFKWFSGDWEQRKLGDLVIIRSGLSTNTQKRDGLYKITRIETISEGVINENKVGTVSTKPDNKFLMHTGDILFSNINSLSHIGKVAIFNGSFVLYHGMNLLRLITTSLVNPYFIYYELTTTGHKTWAKAHANPAVSQASINQHELSLETMYITSLVEQEQTARLINKLHTLITLQQKQIDKLNSLKKSLLQNMFI